MGAQPGVSAAINGVRVKIQYFYSDPIYLLELPRLNTTETAASMRCSISTAMKCMACISLFLPSILLAQGGTPARLIPRSDHFDIRFSQVSRFEALEGQYRRANNGSSDQVFIYRSAIEGHYTHGTTMFSVELLDARQALADAGTPLTRRSVDAANLQQLYLTWRWPKAFGTSKVDLNVGRQTLNFGSRRLISRSTSNVPVSFTGAVANLQREQGDKWTVFALAPVLNYPIARADIFDNRIERDKESRGTRFTGVFVQMPEDQLAWRREYYAFHLHEEDAGGEEVADLDISSAGMHLYSSEVLGKLDYDVEAVLQTGKSRASSAPSDVRDLSHRAYFYHLALGYSLDAPLAPHLQLLYDFASGDKHPSDGENNRFDTLFGARRSEFGPSSLYGPFYRANLSTLGLRLSVNPSSALEMTFTLREFALASSRDEWGKSAWVDSSGQAGRDLGRHLETRMRWDAIPGNFMVDTGMVWLHSGDFPREVSLGNTPSLTRYAYVQTSLSF
jgi:hypothetical protein